MLIRLRAYLHHQMHTLSVWSHKLEHPIHLTYFGALSTGLLDYHLIAGGCFALGIIALLPKD